MADQDSAWFILALVIVGCGALLLGMLHGAVGLVADALARRSVRDEADSPKAANPTPALRVSPSTASADAAANRLAASLMKSAN